MDDVDDDSTYLFQMNSKDSDETGQMHRVIRVFV